MNNPLKPCPFCGGQAYAAIDDYGRILIGCEKCHLYFGVEVEDGCELVDGWRAVFPDVETAITAWNERSVIDPETLDIVDVKGELIDFTNPETWKAIFENYLKEGKTNE